MSQSGSAPGPGRTNELAALASALRPELHAYSARLMGSVIDGEDVVQDTMVRALAALETMSDPAALRPWLFRIAHNRALDLLRSRAVHKAEAIDAAADIPDLTIPDPVEALMRQEAVNSAVSRFAELPVAQRSVLILKDVLGETLIDIADLLGLSVDAVKGHLARGRARLRAINAQAGAVVRPRPASAAVSRYVELFNQKNWQELRALLADDVKLVQSTHPARFGSQDVSMFFTTYAGMDEVRLEPAWLEGREVILVFEGCERSRPSYMKWLEWKDGRISFIRDYRYVRYVMQGAEMVPLTS